jgi:multidrug efflux pump
MTSTSALGATAITLQFDLNRNIDAAARDIEAAINAARGYLPTDLPNNPTYRKVNPADAPILIVALTSDVYDPGRLYDVASTILQQKLSQIDGVGQVTVGGSSLPAVRVEVNPTALNKYGLGLEDIRNMLSVQNANRPKGRIADDTTTSDLAANDQLLKADAYKRCPQVVGCRQRTGFGGRLTSGRNNQWKAVRAGGYFSRAGGEYHRYRGPRAGGPSSAQGFHSCSDRSHGCPRSDDHDPGIRA